jgi:hypothetical protein
VDLSELLLAEVAMRVGKVAIERKDRIVDQRIGPEVKALDRFAPRRDAAERRVELSQVPGFDDDVEFAEPAGPRPSLRRVRRQLSISPSDFRYPRYFCVPSSSATSLMPGFRSHQM